MLALCAAVAWRHSSYLSAEASALGHEWYYVHQADAVHVARAAEEGAPFPLWSPWMQAGSPLFAVPTKPFTYPPFVLGILALGPYLGMNLLTLAHLVLGGTGTALLLRRFGTGWLAATLGALLFALAARPGDGFFAVPFGHGYAVAWWPFTTLALLRVLEAPSTRAALLLGLCGALQVHAGGEMSSYWLACFLAAFALPWLRESGTALARSAACVALAALVGVGLSAVTLLPSLEWLAESGRATARDPAWALDRHFEELHAELGGGSRFVTLGHAIAMNYRGAGAATTALGLALAGWAALRRPAAPATGLLLGTATALVLASGALHDELFALLPGYDKLRWPTRFLNVAGFGAALLAGLGFDLALRAAARRASWLPGALAAGLATLLALELGPSPHAANGSAPERRTLAGLTYPDTSQGGRVFCRRPEDQPVWAALGIESTGGLLGGAGSENDAFARWLPDRGPAWQEEHNGFVLDALGVETTVFRKQLAPAEVAGLELVFRPRDVEGLEERMNELLVPRPFVFRRPGALARVSLVDGPALVVGAPAAREAALRAAFVRSEVRAGTHVFLESPVDDVARLAPDDAAGAGSVVLAGLPADDPGAVAWRARAGGRLVDLPPLGAVWTPARRGGAEDVDPLAARRVEPLDDALVTKRLARLDVDLAGRRAGFLLVSERFTLQRGWSATVDGVPAPLLRADGPIAAVRLPEGALRVAFRYVPPGLRAGLWITGLTAAGWVLAWALAGSARRGGAA